MGLRSTSDLLVLFLAAFNDNMPNMHTVTGCLNLYSGKSLTQLKAWVL